MTLRGRLSFFSLIILLGSSAAVAAPLRLSIDEAIRLALGGGTQSVLARSAEERARIARREAFANLLPQAEARLSRYNQSINLATFGFSIPGQPPVVGPFNVTDAQISAAVQLFNLAALRRYEALQQEESASRFDTEQADNDVAAAVARLYVMVERAEAQIAARQADVKLFETLGRVSQDELKAGTGTRLDVAQSNVQLLRARQALLIARNDRDATRLALLNAIGADEASELVVSGELAPSSPEEIPGLESSIERARSQRPELRQAELRQKEARFNISAARSRMLPAIGLNFEGDISGNHNNDLHSSRRIAATASIPLFRADIRANIARAQLQLRDAETLLSQRKRDVEQEVRRTLLGLESAQARVVFAVENVRVSEEALTVSRDRRSAGYGSPIEVDRAQDSYRQAHEDLIAVRADAVAARFDYEHATGDIHRYVPAPGSNQPAKGGNTPLSPQTRSGVSTSSPAGGVSVTGTSGSDSPADAPRPLPGTPDDNPASPAPKPRLPATPSGPAPPGDPSALAARGVTLQKAAQ